MAYRYFPGKDATWLLAALDKVMTDQASGRVVISASAGDVSFSHLNMMDVEECMRRIRHDLVLVDPVTYPPEDHIPVTMTKATFS